MTARLRAIELGMSGHHPTPVVVACARQAERCDVRRFWLAENYYARSISIQATAVCQATRRIDVGLGVFNPYTRRAPLIAMEVATLDEVSGGRITLALGAGRLPAEHLAVDQTKGITMLRESIEICRRLLGGDTLGYEGVVHRFPPGAVQLAFRPPRGGAIPIMLGAMGPRLLRLAGAVADGAFMSVFTSPALAREMRPHVEAGLRDAGRTVAGFSFSTYVLFAVDRARQVARDLVRPSVADYLTRRITMDRLTAAGIHPAEAEEVCARVRAARGVDGPEAAIRLVPDSFCDRLTICGTPEDCCAGLSALADAGITTAIPYNILGKDPVRAVRIIAREIAPQVCSAT